mmetsp:Transcript_28812/g.51722  ORF Transcript_28812/g.51722 Transcript_28812/m.51722 type:complete len:401 (+) Transcript_28812:38-1240(+)
MNTQTSQSQIIMIARVAPNRHCPVRFIIQTLKLSVRCLVQDPPAAVSCFLCFHILHRFHLFSCHQISHYVEAPLGHRRGLSNARPAAPAWSHFLQISVLIRQITMDLLVLRYLSEYKFVILATMYRGMGDLHVRLLQPFHLCDSGRGDGTIHVLDDLKLSGDFSDTGFQLLQVVHRRIQGNQLCVVGHGLTVPNGCPPLCTLAVGAVHRAKGDQKTMHVIGNDDRHLPFLRTADCWVQGLRILWGEGRMFGERVGRVHRELDPVVHEQIANILGWIRMTHQDLLPVIVVPGRLQPPNSTAGLGDEPTVRMLKLLHKGDQDEVGRHMDGMGGHNRNGPVPPLPGPHRRRQPTRQLRLQGGPRRLVRLPAGQGPFAHRGEHHGQRVQVTLGPRLRQFWEGVG